VPTKWSYPFTVGDGKDASDAHTFFEALSNAEDGFYPLGANGIWHGGIHFDNATGKLLKQEDGVRAIADGEVVAYRLDSSYPVLKYQDGKSCVYSTGFVLVRHKLVLPPAPTNGSNSVGRAGAATGASHAAAASSASSASSAQATPQASSPSATATPAAPADETLTFFSLYMHLLDWSGYKAVLDAPPPASDPSKTSNQPARSPVKCMPFWKGEKRYRVSVSAADTQREPSAFDFSLPDSMRLDSPDSSFGLSDAMPGAAALPGSSLNWQDPLAPPSDSNAANPFRIDQQPTAKPKAKQPLAKGAQIYSKAKGEPIALLPQGCELQLGEASEKDKGWAPITKFMKGEPVGLVVGDPVDSRAPTGWIKVDQFDLLIDPQPLDTVVVLEKPCRIDAGTVVGYLGEYQRYREASKLRSAPPRSLVHVEVFAGPDLPAFIKKSQARAKQLPDQKAFVEVQKGALLVDVADANATVKSGLLLKPLAKDAGAGPWVKVQPTQITMPPTQVPGHGHPSHSHHAKAKPIETPEGTPVWVERAFARHPAPPNMKAWSGFPLDLAHARGPAAGFDEVFSHAELGKLGADAKAQDDTHATWWKITVGTSDGDSREGWVRDTGHKLVESHSPWDWPGFDLVDNTGVSMVDSFKRHLHVYDMLFEGDKEEFEPSAIRVNGSDLIKKLKRTADRLVSSVSGTTEVTDLENAVDRLGNNDGKVSGQELARAQRTRWVAQAMSHLVVRYESEWGGNLSKWESLSSLMKERKYIWQAELERIKRLQWWGQVSSVDGVPKDAVVYHLHPVGLVGNFIPLRAPVIGTSSFPADVISAARAAQAKWGIPASITLGQWAYESGFGHHMPSGSNNPFGIKANKHDRETGNYVEAMTGEVVNGVRERVPQPFRKFASLDEAFEYHGQLLATGKAYAVARACLPDAHGFANGLTDHYATEPDYGGKLIRNYIDPYNLTQYDLQ
jgi:flagellum-specific peptidoglycan hydrolase FlgJ